eukprot:s2114_g12.t1
MFVSPHLVARVDNVARDLPERIMDLSLDGIVVGPSCNTAGLLRPEYSASNRNIVLGCWWSTAHASLISPVHLAWNSLMPIPEELYFVMFPLTASSLLCRIPTWLTGCDHLQCKRIFD